MIAEMIKRYVVKGHSMEPNFREGDKIILSSLFFRLRIGDVVVFREGKTDYLKRIIASKNGSYVAKGDNAQHTGQFMLARSQVKGKFLAKY